jgi:hypothetical protein
MPGLLDHLRGHPVGRSLYGLKPRFCKRCRSIMITQAAEGVPCGSPPCAEDCQRNPRMKLCTILGKAVKHTQPTELDAESDTL